MDLSALMEASSILSKIPGFLEKMLPLLLQWEKTNQLAPGEKITYNIAATEKTLLVYVWVVSQREVDGDIKVVVQRQISSFNIMEYAQMAPEEILMKFSGL